MGSDPGKRPATAVPSPRPPASGGGPGYAQIFHALGDALLVTDPRGLIVDCNPAAEELLGHPRDALLGRTPAQIGGPGHQGFDPREVAATVARDGFWAADVTLAGTDDRVTAVRVTAVRVTAVRDGAGHQVGFVAVYRDVTVERRLSGEITQLEERWRGMLDVAPTGLGLVTLEGRFERVNPALCRIVGYPEDVLVTLTFQQITHPDDLEADLALVQQLVSGQIENYRMEKRYLHARGHDVFVQLSVGLVRSADTHLPLRFVIAVEDVTQRRLAADRLASIIAGASDAFVAIAPAGYVTEWNTAAERLFGWTRPEALGRPLTELVVPPEQHAAHRAGLVRMQRGTEGRILGVPVQLEARTKDGRRIPAELTVWRAAGATGEFYAFIRDITARARAAERQAAIAAAQLEIAEMELSPNKIMQHICEHAVRLTGAEGAALEVVERGELVTRAATGTSARTTGARRPLADPLSRPTSPGDDASVLVTPLRRGTAVLGALTVTAAAPAAFTAEDSSALELLAAPFGAALVNAWQLQASHEQARTDGVTGLPNRTHALAELDRALLRQGRHGGTLAVVFADLDRFKEVNDTLGHAAGDHVLTSVAGKLREAVRGSDTPARFGGDEFLIVCEGLAEPGDVRVLAERLIASLPGSYPYAGGGAEIGCSIGVAVSRSVRPAQELLDAADGAMYEAKRAGGDRYVVRFLDG